MKRKIGKIIICCSMVLIVSGLILMPALAAADSEEEVTTRSGLTWDEIRALEYDYDSIAVHIARMEELAVEAENSGQAEHEQEVLELYQQLLLDMDIMSTCYVSAHIAYFTDIQNDELGEREKQVYLDYVELDDEMSGVMSAVIRSPYQEILSGVMTEEEMDMLYDYEVMTDREKELIEQESDLVTEYSQAAAQEFSVTIDGKEWTYDTVMTDAEDIETAAEVYQELSRVENEALSGIYKELTEIRTELAVNAGYDNYLDYALQEIYGKDYGTEEMEALFRDIKEYAVPLFSDLQSAFYMAGVDTTIEIDSSPEKILDTLAPYMTELGEDMYDSFTYMREHNLVDINASEAKGEGGFTAGLPYYGEAFLFLKPSEDYSDYGSMIHEFGHYYNEMCDQEPVFYGDGSLDVLEIHSTGLQVLFREYSDDMFGEEDGELFNTLQIMDIFQSAILYQSMITEFEMEVYRNPDMSIQDMNRFYATLQEEYGLDMGMGLMDVPKYEEAYGWVEIQHLYESPLYCVSYVTSGLSALDLFVWAQEDREEAVAGYFELVAMPGSIGYLETIGQCGLQNIFAPGAVPQILNDCVYWLSHENEAFGEMGASEEANEAYGAKESTDSEESSLDTNWNIWEGETTAESRFLFVFISAAVAIYGTSVLMMGIITGIIVLARKKK